MHVKDSWSQLLLEIVSAMLVPAIPGSRQLRFRVEQTVPCQICGFFTQAMEDYVMSRRCTGGYSEFCSLVSRLYDRESGNKKLNGYAMTWDDSSNIEYNVTHILKFPNESIYIQDRGAVVLVSVTSIAHFDCWPQPLVEWIMRRNIESSICFPHLQVVESASLTAFFSH